MCIRDSLETDGIGVDKVLVVELLGVKRVCPVSYTHLVEGGIFKHLGSFVKIVAVQQLSRINRVQGSFLFDWGRISGGNLFVPGHLCRVRLPMVYPLSLIHI